MALNQKDMESNEKEGNNREHRHVEGVEAGERITGHIDTSPEKGFNEAARHRQVARASSSNAHRGECPFIPDEKVSGEPKKMEIVSKTKPDSQISSRGFL